MCKMCKLKFGVQEKFFFQIKKLFLKNSDLNYRLKNENEYNNKKPAVDSA